MAEAVLTSLEERERVFRRAVAISAGAHLALLLLAFLSPFPRSHSVTLPGVDERQPRRLGAERARRRAQARGAAACQAGGEARGAEAGAAPAPAEARGEGGQEAPAEGGACGSRSRRLRSRSPPWRPPKPEEKLDYEDALDALREEPRGEEAGDAPDPELLASVRPGPQAGPAGGGPGEPVDPEVAAWMRRVKIHVTRELGAAARLQAPGDPGGGAR